MATTNKKQFNVKAVLFAAGGGIAAGVLTEVLEKNIDSFRNNPKMTPAALAVISAAGLYFAPDEYAPAFYGMIGASAGDIGAQLIQGNQDKKLEAKMLEYNMENDLENITQLLPEAAQNIDENLMFSESESWT